MRGALDIVVCVSVCCVNAMKSMSHRFAFVCLLADAHLQWHSFFVELDSAHSYTFRCSKMKPKQKMLVEKLWHSKKAMKMKNHKNPNN